MLINNQNVFNQQGWPPGRAIKKVKRLAFPSGQVIELRWIIVTSRDQQGVWRTEELFEVDPPPKDGCLVTEDNYPDLQECNRCQRIVLTSYECPRCCLRYGADCTTKDPTEETTQRFCVDCAKAVKHPVLYSILKIISGIFEDV
jgi:hypothetical protein